MEKTKGSGKRAKIFCAVATTVAAGATVALIITLMRKPKQVSVDGFNVTYIDSNNDQTLTKQQHMIYASKPNDYTFTNPIDQDKSKISHWYFEKECKNEFNFSTKLDGDVSLYGKWESSQYNYVVHNYEKEETESDPLSRGKVPDYNNFIQKDTLIAPEKPRKKFEGWHQNKGCTDEKIKFPFKVTKDVHIWPNYEQTETLIKFENCEKEITTTECGDTTRIINDPVKKDNEFLGWTIDNVEGISVYENDPKNRIHLSQNEYIKKSDGSVNYLNWKFWNCDTLTLRANWKQSHFNVAFYSKQDASGDPIKTFESAKIITANDIKDIVPTNIPNDKHFYGWVLSTASAGEKADKSSCIDFTRDGGYPITGITKFVPVLVSPDATATVKMNGGRWKKESEIVDCDTSYTIDVWSDVKMTNNDIVNRIKIKAERTDWELIGTAAAPSFRAFAIDGGISLIEDPIIITGETLIAVYNDANHITVSFSANGGMFVYDDGYGGTLSSEIISCTVDLTQQSTWTLKQLYDEAKSTKTNCKIEYDGYLPNDGTVSELYYYGWMLKGTYVPDSYSDIKDGSAFIMDWKKATPNDFWTDGWTVVSNVAAVSLDEFHKQYWKAYQSNTANGQAGGNVKWGSGSDVEQSFDETYGSFVGLEKEITLNGYGTFKTRIISQGQDIRSDTNKKVAFTFDFIEMPTIASIGKNNDYVNGYITNNYIPLIKYSFPSGLRNNLKRVYKPVLKSSADSPYYEGTTINADMFVPSAYEVNGGTEERSGQKGTVYNSSAYVESVQFKDSPYLFVYQWYKYQYDLDYSSSPNPPQSTPRTVSDLSSSALTHYRAKKFTYYDQSQGQFVTANSSWILRTPVISSIYAPYNYNSNSLCSFYVCDDSETHTQGSDNKPYLGGIYDYWSSDARCLSLCFCI